MANVPNIAENLNRLSRAHERYRRQTDRRQTDGRQQIAKVNVSSRSLKNRLMCNAVIASQMWDVSETQCIEFVVV